MLRCTAAVWPLSWPQT